MQALRIAIRTACIPGFGAGQQRGAATLTIAVVILFLGMIASLGFAKAVLMEQKIASNSLRAAQAFAAAEAGMQAALSYLDEDADRDRDGRIDPVFAAEGAGPGTARVASIGGGSVTVTTEDLSNGAMTHIRVNAIGHSDDRSTRRTVAQTFITLDPVPNLPRSPVIAGGMLDIRGTAAVQNPYGEEAVWSGAGAQVHDSGTFNIATPDTTNTSYPQCLAQSQGCALGPAVAADDSTGMLTHDSSLGSLAASELFRSLFGLVPAAFAATMVTRATTPATLAQAAQLAGREVIRIDGDAEPRDLTSGCRERISGHAHCPGSSRAPVLVIIDGDARIAQDLHLYGLLFVSGALAISGSARVHGAVVVTGDIVIESGAELELWFDADLLADLHKAGPMAPVAGSWQEL